MTWIYFLSFRNNKNKRSAPPSAQQQPVIDFLVADDVSLCNERKRLSIHFRRKYTIWIRFYVNLFLFSFFFQHRKGFFFLVCARQRHQRSRRSLPCAMTAIDAVMNPDIILYHKFSFASFMCVCDDYTILSWNQKVTESKLYMEIYIESSAVSLFHKLLDFK